MIFLGLRELVIANRLKAWALSIMSLTDYIPTRIVVHLCDVLWEFMPEVLGTMKDVRPMVVGGYEIPLHQSDVHGMRTFPFDESTLPGISDILDGCLKEIGVNKYEALYRKWLVVGNLFTLLKIEALREIQVRDFCYNRHEYAVKTLGAFHMEMAAEDALFRAYWGHEDEMDPGSLCHLKYVLRVKGISASIPEYNSCKRFSNTCAKGFALAAFCEILNADSFEMLRNKLKNWGEYVRIAEEVVLKLFMLRTVRLAREKAEVSASREWQEVIQISVLSDQSIRCRANRN